MNTGLINFCQQDEVVVFRRLVVAHPLSPNTNSVLELSHVDTKPSTRIVGLSFAASFAAGLLPPLSLSPSILGRVIISPFVPPVTEWESLSWFERQQVCWPVRREFPPFVELRTDAKVKADTYTVVVDVALIGKVRP